MIIESLPQKPEFLNLLQDSGFFPAFFESQAPNEQTGRYSILPANPNLQITAFDHKGLEDLLKAIDQKPNPRSTELPFEAGWVVYLSYECAAHFEPKLAKMPSLESNEPLAVAIYCQGALVHDHQEHKTWLCAENALTLNALKLRLSDSMPPSEFNDLQLTWSEESSTAFKKQVEEAKQWIIDGDIYQANLSRQWQAAAENNINPLAVLAALRVHNPAPFASFLQTETWSLVSASPERLVQVKNGQISTRPIAGTRPRSADVEADEALIDELLNTPKERAEHIMLIDLERNDIGRVSEEGSVKVDELMVIESYPTVHHIVSNVVGQLKADASVVDVLRALFPGGTITGCPKVRCMEIIAESEGRPRGFYTGSMGYINHDGQMDFNILIRSLGIQGQSLNLFAGAGIVYDSDPEAELKETGHKAQGLFNVLKAMQ